LFSPFCGAIPFEVWRGDKVTWLRDYPRLLISVPGSREWKEHWPDKMAFSKRLILSAVHGVRQAAVRTHSVKEQIVGVFQESLICVAHKFYNAFQ
jgi:hypothetical protein